MEEFNPIGLKDNYERGRFALVGMRLVLLTMFLTLILHLTFFTMFYIMEVNLTFSTRGIMLQVESVVSGLHALCFVLSAIAFVLWFRRAYFNLHKVSQVPRYEDYWAVWSWGVPVFGLFGPYHIATDLFTGTEKILVKNNLLETERKRHIVKGWWWAAWLVFTLLAGVEGFGGVFAFIKAVSLLGGTVSAALAIKMIKNYREMEELLPQVEYIYLTGRDSELLDNEF